MIVESTKPSNQAPINWKFDGSTSYKNCYASRQKTEEATGDALKAKTLEQTKITREVAKLGKRGTYMGQGKKPFLGHSSATKAQQDVLNNKRFGEAKL